MAPPSYTGNPGSVYTNCETALVAVNLLTFDWQYAHRPYSKRELLLNTPVILCVDDDVPALAIRCMVLSTAGYEVVTAADGVAALELFRCIQVDLVVADYWLPRQTGVQVAAEMKRLKPAIPVILFSGVVEAPPGSEVADLVFTKGMPVEELLSEIGKLISKNGDLRKG
jgi:CheY-like chemotaxis protein